MTDDFDPQECVGGLCPPSQLPANVDPNPRIDLNALKWEDIEDEEDGQAE